MKLLFFKVVLLAVFSFIIDLDCFGLSWSGGYPMVVNGASSIDVKVKTDGQGTVYYGIYSSAQIGLTPVQLKLNVLNGLSSLLRKGSLQVAASSEVTISETGLADNTTYHIYVVAESGGILMTSVRYITRTLPKRLQELTDYSDSKIAGYAMYFPEDYYKDNDGYPLLVFLHGLGERSAGNTPNFSLLTRTGLPYVIKNGRNVPMIVASPQAKWNWSGAQVEIDQFVEYLKEKYRVNADQIFFTGLSMGGTGVFEYANAYPEKVTAIVPVSTWPKGDIANFAKFPVWAFMGSAERGSLYSFILDLQAMGCNATYTEYPGGHSSAVWNPVYDGSRGDDIYSWLLACVGQEEPAPAPAPENTPPVVSAGSDMEITLPVSEVELTGSAADSDGIVSLKWAKVSGPAVTILDDYKLTARLTGLTAGTYVFSFTAGDSQGATATDNVTVTVHEAAEPANTPPVVSAGSDIAVTLPVSEVDLTGTAVDSDGIVSLKWAKVSGPAVTILYDYKITAVLTGLTAGTYVFSFTAGDSKGATATDNVTVTVNEVDGGNGATGEEVTQEIYVNLTWKWNVQGGAWNDFITTDGGPAGMSMALHDADGAATGITMSVLQAFEYYKSNHGMSSGVYPANVMRYFLRSTQSKRGALKLSGLDPAGTYDFSVLCSTYDTWYPTDTRLTIAGQSAVANAMKNTSNLAVISGVSPDENGELTISVDPATTASGNSGIINAIVITRHGSSATSSARISGTQNTLLAESSPETTRDVTFFPNPVRDYLTVEVDPAGLTGEKFGLELFDLNGVRVYAEQVSTFGSTEKIVETIYTGFMSSGLYIMQIQGAKNGVKKFKILKK